MNETEKFLKACSKNKLKLQVVEGDIFISGDTKATEKARRSLDNSKELKQSVTAILRERAAKEEAQSEPQAQERQRQAEPHVYTYEEVTANYNRAHEELKRRLAVNPNTSPYSPFFIDDVTDKVAGYKWTAELAKLRERQALQAKDI